MASSSCRRRCDIRRLQDCGTGSRQVAARLDEAGQRRALDSASVECTYSGISLTQVAHPNKEIFSPHNSLDSVDMRPCVPAPTVVVSAPILPSFPPGFVDSKVLHTLTRRKTKSF